MILYTCRTKYGNNKHISWNFKLGENCCEIKIFCPFMRTNSNSRCSKGDLLLIRSTGRNSKFCRFKKPGKDKPLTLLGDAKIIWKTDRRGKERGFECLIRCSDNCQVTTTTSTTTTTSSRTTGRSCTITGGTNLGHACVFPFHHNGQTYDGCSFDPTRDVAPWCTDSFGARGLCSASCPLDSRISTFAPTLVSSPPAECACGTVRKRTKILNGQESQINEFPWMVGLSHMWSVRPFCGGVLISDQYILTAAHCCLRREATDIHVFLGDHNWMESTEVPSIRRKVVSIKTHPAYGQQTQFNYDVCLIKVCCHYRTKICKFFTILNS